MLGYHCTRMAYPVHTMLRKLHSVITDRLLNRTFSNCQKAGKIFVLFVNKLLWFNFLLLVNIIITLCETDITYWS